MAFLVFICICLYVLSVERVQAPRRDLSTAISAISVPTEKVLTQDNPICPADLTPEFGDYCYTFLTRTYPYQCPYKKTLQILEPPFMAIVMAAKVEHVWLLQKHSSFRYFEQETFGPYYKLLFNNEVSTKDSTSVNDSCLIGYLESSKYLVSCNSTHISGMCLYKFDDVDFCEVYHSICNKTCDGKSKFKKDFLCGANYIEDNSCEECDKKFEDYPEPTINLKLLNNKEILIVVENYKKTVSNRVPGAETFLSIYSFTDNLHPTDDSVYGRIRLSEPFQKVSESIAMSSIAFTTNASVFWFEMFTYPNLTSIKSEELIISSGLSSFIVNITMDYWSEYFIPFEEHAVVSVVLTSLFGSFIAKCSLLELYPPFNNGTMITLGFHILTYTTEDDALKDMEDILHNSNFKNYSVATNEYCLSITEGELSWNKTRLGAMSPTKELLVDRNGLPITRSCEGSFKQGAYWSALEDRDISEESPPLTKRFFELSQSNDSAWELNEKLLSLIQGVEDIIAYDVYLIARCLQRIIFSGEPYDVKTTVDIVDAIMNFDSEQMFLAQFHLNATDSIIYYIDVMMQNFINEGAKLTIVEGEQIFSQIASLEDTNITGMAIYKRKSSIQVKTLIDVHAVEQIDATDLILATFLPSTLNINDLNHPYLITTVYLDNILFNSLEPNSASNVVLSIFIPNQNYIYLEKPLTVIFGESIIKINNVSCAYWNYGINNQLVSLYGEWEPHGDLMVNSKYKVCYFDHMTHFALIFEAPESKALNIVTAIMCGLSILGILSIFFTASALTNWRKGEGIKVLLNYSAAILLQDVLLLLFDLTDTNYHVACTFYAIFLQYSILAQFTWMLIISYIQYERLVTVFNTRTSTFKKLVIFGWTVPLFPIAVNLCVDITIYIQGNYCFITKWTLYLSLFLPIIIVVIINMIIFFKIVVSIFSKVACKVSGDSLVKQKISVCIILFFLSGFAWTFGFLAKMLESMAMSYIFCLFSTGQGLVLWVYFVLLNKEVKKFLMRSKLVSTISSIGKDFHLPRFYVSKTTENNGLCVNSSSITSNSNTSDEHVTKY